MGEVETQERRPCACGCGKVLDRYSHRRDARYYDVACRMRAYRGRKVDVETIDAGSIVDHWFVWWPPDIRSLLLGRVGIGNGKDAADWGRWLPTSIIEEETSMIVRGGPVRVDSVVHARGGPGGWYWREVPLRQFLSEATPSDRDAHKAVTT